MRHWDQRWLLLEAWAYRGGEVMLQRQGVLHQEAVEPDPCHSLAPAWPFGWPSASVATWPYGSGTIPAKFVEEIYQ